MRGMEHVESGTHGIGFGLSLHYEVGASCIWPTKYIGPVESQPHSV